MKNYKLDKEIKKRMERELRQYYDNREKLKNLKSSKTETRRLLYLEEKIHYVENVYGRLNSFEKQVYNLIFRENCDSLYCEIHKGISRSTYYNVLNKSIRFLAEEWGEI